DAVTTMRMAMTALVALITTMAHAEPLPVPKTGQCPSGYRESGGYCAPMTERGHLSRSPSKGSARQTGCNRQLLPRHAQALRWPAMIWRACLRCINNRLSYRVGCRGRNDCCHMEYLQGLH